MKNSIEYIEEELAQLENSPNVLLLDKENLNDIEEAFGQETIFENINFTSNVKTLATAQTVYLSSKINYEDSYTQKKKDICDNAKSTLLKVFEYLRKCPLLLCQRRGGDNNEWTFQCDLYISYYKKEASHIACMFNAMTFPLTGNENGKIKVICIPEWNEKDRQILVIPEIGVTFILGSDYYEEVKNACLRLSICKAKEKNYLPLHAATKIITTTDKAQNKKKVGMVIFGINSTGKSTHTLHDHGFKNNGEAVQILQDDLVFFTEKGSLLGSERGFYIRTDSLSGSKQPLLYNFVQMPQVYFENVMVDFQGNIYFEDKNITGNSHAIIPREALNNYSTCPINMPELNELDDLIFIFMAKNFTCVPIVSKLTYEEAAACYMLSEPFDAMASEFNKCDGKTGLASMPCGVGNNVEDVNLFYEIINNYEGKLNCYMINNGGVGELIDTSIDGTRKIKKKVSRVSIPEISLVIRALVKDNINWIDDKNWLIKIPEKIEGMNINKYDLYNYYDQDKIDSLISQIRSERRAFCDNYIGLNKNIADSIEF